MKLTLMTPMLEPPVLGLPPSFSLSPSAGLAATASVSSILYDRFSVSAVERIAELPFDVAPSARCWSFSRASFSWKVKPFYNKQCIIEI